MQRRRDLINLRLRARVGLLNHPTLSGVCNRTFLGVFYWLKNKPTAGSIVNIIKFPSSHNLYKSYVARLNEYNETIAELLEKTEEMNETLSLLMHDYLSVLSSMMSELSEEDVRKFLKEEGSNHSLRLVATPLSFQLSMEFE